MSQSPEEIRTQIDATRSRLGSDVDALADKVSPTSIAHRQTQKIRGSVGRVRDRIMGSADDAGGAVQETAQQAGEAVKDLPHSVVRRTQGNPLAAGLIAFGTGWLMSALVPASESEKQAAQKVKEEAQPFIEEAGEAAKAIAADMKQPAQDAVEHMKDTAQESVENVKAESADAADGVKDRAKTGQEHVQQTARANGPAN
ncbi:hypothetical protein B5P43_31185 [Bacillus sp. SRB_336]|nr:hypothetical protein B5P43_31185 [Bacillus sp. SRB_336]